MRDGLDDLVEAASGGVATLDHVEAAARLLRDEERATRLLVGDSAAAPWVAEVLKRWQPRSGATARALVSQLVADPGNASVYGAALIAMGRRAVPALLEAPVSQASEASRHEVARALSVIEIGGDPDCVALLVRLAGDPSEDVRIAAINGLGSHAPSDDNALDTVARAMRDPSSIVRRAALAAATDVWGKTRPSDSLVSGLERVVRLESDPRVQRAALQAAGQFGIGALTLAPALIALLKSGSDLARKEAAASLLRMGAYDGSFLVPFGGQLGLPQDEARWAEALLRGGAGGRSAALRRYAALASDSDPEVRALAARGLGVSGLEGKREAVRALQSLTTDRERTVRDAAHVAIQALGATGGE